MKKNIIQIFAIALLLMIATACKKESVSGIDIAPSNLMVGVGQIATLTVTFIPKTATNKNVSWESSDTKVATVNNGIVTGIAIGKAKIIATSQDGGQTAWQWVYVIQPIEPEEMIWVEGGHFSMGCTDEQGEDCFDNESPTHQVTLNGFYIGKYVVTQKEWVATMGHNPSYWQGDRIPIHHITREKALEYIDKLNAFTGKNYRLPTEAEWEYAARGGNKSQGYKYSGSNNSDEVGWYVESDARIRSVGLKKSNELGIYDMSGNVWEFCSDWYGKYTDESQINPMGPTTGDYCVIRGGGMSTGAEWARVSTRTLWWSDGVIGNGSFRLVLDKE